MTGVDALIAQLDRHGLTDLKLADSGLAATAIFVTRPLLRG
jgi:hypothetical protein